ncbi:MAG: NAD(P)H-quinone dehydrogenase [Actinomycetes bacterium]
MTAVVIIGGGPGGYEAALVGRQLGADITLIDSNGLGGSAVLTDCVPSKTLIATANAMHTAAESGGLGVMIDGQPAASHLLNVNLDVVNTRVKALATAQSEDIHERLLREGVQIVHGHGRLSGSTLVLATTPAGDEMTYRADAVLIATGARPRQLADAMPDGDRIVNWEQLYDLKVLPARLIVVGSGVTGAEFASAYHGLGSQVVLISSRDRVLPGEDPDAAAVLEEVYARRGLEVISQARALSARRTEDGVVVKLADGRQIFGSHVLMAVGSIPNTEHLGLKDAGVDLDKNGFIKVDRVSRTSTQGVYAAGDCTGVFKLASVAAMQGRIAMWHALGDAVNPLDLHLVSSNVFTSPEIATVGLTQQDLDEETFRGDVIMLPFATNARAKMQDQHDGFVKIFCRRGSRLIAGAVVVGINASELIHVLTVALAQRMTVDELASAFTVYPSLSGSIAEAARRLHVHSE